MRLHLILYSQKGANKDKYRLFNIPKNLAGNDVGSIEHALLRRLKYYEIKETKPDLLLIDGGKAQLKFAEKLINTPNIPISRSFQSLKVLKE